MIALGCDHGGFILKEFLKAHLDKRGIAYRDFGPDTEESVDYPVYAEKVCRAIQSGECDGGILCCGTGIGMSMAANKFRGIRCALLSDPFCARLTKEHNNANVIAFGGRVTGTELAAACFDAWYDAEFLGGRHQRRIDLVASFEK